MPAGIDPGVAALLQNSNKNGGQDNWWVILLILLMGRRGFGEEAAVAAGVRDNATLADLNAMQNTLQNSIFSSQNAITERTLDLTRDNAANALRMESDFNQVQAQIAANSNANLIGQKDLAAQMCECCCKLGIGQKDIENAINVQGLTIQNAIDKCCCENQNAIAMQTNVLQQTICQDGDKTRALITQNRMDDLQSQLQIARDENSNLRQTEVLSRQIREQCGQHHPHWPWWLLANGNGNGGPPGPPPVNGG
jgi:hypothetical protein